MSPRKPKMIPLESSNVHSYHYSEDGTLRVRFRSGGVYEYDQVPADVMDELSHAESFGSAFHKLVKGKYECWKVSDGEREKR